MPEDDELTHIRAVFIEMGRMDLANIAFHNRGDWPAMDWCRFDRQWEGPVGNSTPIPSVVDALIVDRAFKMWYMTFAPHKLPLVGCREGDNFFVDLLSAVQGMQNMYMNHWNGECQCPQRDYGRAPKRSKVERRRN